MTDIHDLKIGAPGPFLPHRRVLAAAVAAGIVPMAGGGGVDLRGHHLFA